MSIISKLVEDALKEDIPTIDITSDYLLTDEIYSGKFIAKGDGIISGIDLMIETFRLVDSSLKINVLVNDGDVVNVGDVIANIEGLALSILKGERVALNFMQRMSGIATLTSLYVRETKDTNTCILDTRKTTPNLRYIEKLAVTHGGGKNHRYSLSDQVMIKDNHIKAIGSITKAVNIIKSKIDSKILIEVEIENIEQFKEALTTDCNIIMLDNMSNELMSKCVKLNNGLKKLEASGNMSINRIADVAATGVDYISVGALTHSYTSLDISLKF